MAIIAVGVCVGFLPHNFNPARIFMGDGGALLLGLLMAVSTSVVGGRADTDQRFIGQTYFFLAPLVLPLFILGVPVLDLLFAIVRRATRRKALDVADKGHLHHRLMNLGHGHRRSVLILWTWTALLSAFVLYPVLSGENPTYLPFGMAAHRHRAVHGAAPERPPPHGPTARCVSAAQPRVAAVRRGAPAGLAAGRGDVVEPWRAGRRAARGRRRRRPPSRPTPARRRPRCGRHRPRRASADVGPPGSISTLTGRSTDADDRAHVVDAAQPRRVEHVGARLLVRLQPADRVVEVVDTADAGSRRAPS